MLSIIEAFCFPYRFHRFNLINFTGWIYSGNGNLLQGDIYRGEADGRAAWREIKSDCLGKSESSTRAIGTTPPPFVLVRNTFLPPSHCAAYQPRNEEHEGHTYRNISGPPSSPASSHLLVRTFQPIRCPYERDEGRHYHTRSPPKVFPEQR